MATPAWDTDKAFGCGISFSPGRLYGQARAFGADQQPKMGASEVVCAALTEYLKARGYLSPSETEANQADQAVLTQARRLGLDPIKAIAAAMEVHLSQQAPVPA